METPQEYYERLRKGGWTEDITSNEYPDYKEPFYQNIFRLMEGYARLCDGKTSSKKSVLPISGVIARLFPHKHKWQKRGANRYGTTTYRMCLKCRETQKRVNNIGEPDRFEACDPIPHLDAQFDKNDKYILMGYNSVGMV